MWGVDLRWGFVVTNLTSSEASRVGCFYLELRVGAGLQRILLIDFARLPFSHLCMPGFQRVVSSPGPCLPQSPLPLTPCCWASGAGQLGLFCCPGPAPISGRPLCIWLSGMGLSQSSPPLPGAVSLPPPNLYSPPNHTQYCARASARGGSLPLFQR